MIEENEKLTLRVRCIRGQVEAVECGAGSAREQWLRQALKDHPAKSSLAYWHKPLFSSGAKRGNDPEIKPLWDALYAADAEIVIGGRDHDYERFAHRTRQERVATSPAKMDCFHVAVLTFFASSSSGSM